MAKSKEESVSIKEVVKVLNDNSDGKEIKYLVDSSNHYSLAKRLIMKLKTHYDDICTQELIS